MAKAHKQTYGFEELHAWKRAMDLVDQVYVLTENWPNREQYGLTNQIRRAAVSVPSNIAEGQGRKSDGDFVRFLAIAYGSLMEVRTQLLIASRRAYSSEAAVSDVLAMLDETGRLLNGLKRSLSGRSKKS
jgi:four helix bundle protein